MFVQSEKRKRINQPFFFWEIETSCQRESITESTDTRKNYAGIHTRKNESKSDRTCSNIKRDTQRDIYWSRFRTHGVCSEVRKIINLVKKVVFFFCQTWRIYTLGKGDFQRVWISVRAKAYRFSRITCNTIKPLNKSRPGWHDQFDTINQAAVNSLLSSPETRNDSFFCMGWVFETLLVTTHKWHASRLIVGSRRITGANSIIVNYGKENTFYERQRHFILLLLYWVEHRLQLRFSVKFSFAWRHLYLPSQCFRTKCCRKVCTKHQRT